MSSATPLRQGRFAEADTADAARRRRPREAAEQLRGGIEHARRTGDRMVEARLLLATAEAHAAAQRQTAATADRHSPAHETHPPRHGHLT